MRWLWLPTYVPYLPAWLRPPAWLQRAGQYLFRLTFSSLTRRILSLNLAGLIALVAGVLYLSQFRAGLIDAQAQSLLVQGEIIARAIAATGTSDSNGVTIDPDRLIDLKPGESYRPGGRHPVQPRFPDRPDARGAGAARADLADQDARPHL